MGKDAIEAIVSIATAIVGVAVLAVLVSRQANTAGVIQASASGFSNALGVAIAPVTGANVSPNLAYPTTDAFMGPAASGF